MNRRLRFEKRGTITTAPPPSWPERAARSDVTCHRHPRSGMPTGPSRSAPFITPITLWHSTEKKNDRHQTCKREQHRTRHAVDTIATSGEIDYVDHTDVKIRIGRQHRSGESKHGNDPSRPRAGDSFSGPRVPDRKQRPDLTAAEQTLAKINKLHRQEKRPLPLPIAQRRSTFRRPIRRVHFQERRTHQPESSSAAVVTRSQRSTTRPRNNGPSCNRKTAFDRGRT